MRVSRVFNPNGETFEKMFKSYSKEKAAEFMEVTRRQNPKRRNA